MNISEIDAAAGSASNRLAAARTAVKNNALSEIALRQPGPIPSWYRPRIDAKSLASDLASHISIYYKGLGSTYHTTKPWNITISGPNTEEPV